MLIACETVANVGPLTKKLQVSNNPGKNLGLDPLGSRNMNDN